jgi:hypothetical protein
MDTDPDPDFESGSTQVIESGSSPDPDPDPDPQPWREVTYIRKFLCEFATICKNLFNPLIRD